MKLLNSPFAIFQGPKFLNALNLVVEGEHPITRSDLPNPRTTPSQLRKQRFQRLSGRGVHIERYRR